MKKQLQILLMFSMILAVCAISIEAKGKKYGLFVGINDYPAPISALSGCENDATEMQKVLAAKYGFKLTDTTLLLTKAATRQAIIDKIKMYSAMAEAGDIFVMHYSGHGSLFPDAYSDEKDETTDIFFDDPSTEEVDYPKDKYDATILPYDAMAKTGGRNWRNMILDDELYGLFTEFTKKGAQVVFISDSCHSGDISRNKATVKLRQMPLLRALEVKSFTDLQLQKPATQRNVTDRAMNNLYIVLTGANSDEYASDGAPKAMQMGLFTETLVATLKAKGATLLTYSKLMTKVSTSVKQTAQSGDRDQTPQLEKRFGNVNAKIFSVPK